MSPAVRHRRRTALAVLALAASTAFIVAGFATPTINGAQLAAAGLAIYATVTLARETPLGTEQHA
ncbi:hypothetical protein I2485_01920 [Nesterenkonia sp. E16_7]|uniref:hypothetical protein n=1 Tax=unclassified Nesterenkonia TaxID=2629769 RepID=UPI001A90E242|nr:MULTISPECIES: hypothetical protein [unclassified Nesterenkonia]MBO0596367.1 hypothetical protein [Nesterenkonia sp. E16_10]MBO0597405.1 hypothetical protein [Nesterenkonia sp. E16_7]